MKALNQLAAQMRQARVKFNTFATGSALSTRPRIIRLSTTSLLMALQIASAWGSLPQFKYSKQAVNPKNHEQARRSYSQNTYRTIAWERFHADDIASGQGCYGGCNGLLLYKTKIGSSPIVSSPALYKSGETIVGSPDGNIYDLNRDGSVKAKFGTNGKITSSPCIFEDLGFIVGSNDGNLYEFGSSPTPTRTFQTGGPVDASPATRNSMEYFGSEDGYFYTLDYTFTPYWKIKTGGKITTSPTLSRPDINNKYNVYFTSEDGKVYSYDQNGNQLWTTSLGAPIDSSPVLGNFGYIYVGCTDGKLYCLSQNTGSILWNTQTGGPIYTTPCVTQDESIYFGSDDGFFYSLAPLDGHVLWKYQTGGKIRSSAALGIDKVLYFGSDDSNLYALSLDGIKLWSYATGGPVESSPAIGTAGTVSFGSADGYEYCLGTEHSDCFIGSISSSLPEVIAGHPTTLTISLAQPAPSGGAVIYLSLTYQTWQGLNIPNVVYIPEGQQSVDVRVVPITTLTGSQNVYAFDDNNQVSIDIPVIGNTNGTWPNKRQDFHNSGQSNGSGLNGLHRWSFQAAGQIKSEPTILPDGTVMISTSVGRVYYVSQNGTENWHYQMPSPGYASPTYTYSQYSNGSFWIKSADGTFYTLDCNGSLLSKTFCAPDSSTSSPVYPEQKIVNAFVMVACGKQIFQISNSGSIFHSYTLNDYIEGSPTEDSNGNVYFGCDNGYFYSLDSNYALRWSFKADSAIKSTPYFDGNSNLYFTSANGTLYSVTTAGTKAWAYSLPGGGGTSVACDRATTLFVGTPSGVVCSFTTTGSLNWTFQTGGPITCDPIVDANGVVYFSSSDGNLYSIKPDGTLNWSTAIGTGNSPLSMSPDGTIYYGSQDGKLNAIGSVKTNATLKSFSLPTYIIGGETGTGTITLTQPAPQNGAVVYLVKPYNGISMPFSVYVPAGQSSASFTFGTSTVTNNQKLNVFAFTDDNALESSIGLTVPGPISLSFSPTSVVGGGTVTGTVTLAAPAPFGGYLVNLSSLSACATVQTNVLVAAGQTTATFPVQSLGVSTSTTATIVATDDPINVSGTFTVLPASLGGISLSPISVPGGANVTAQINLTGIAPSGGLVIQLSSNSSAITVPSTVTVPGGQTTLNIILSTSAVGTTTYATVTATDGTNTSKGSVTITPPDVTSLTLNPTIVNAGQSSTGTVTLTGPAPAGGIVVNLTSNYSGATVPSTVTVAAGSTTATFTINTTGVPSKATATIKAQATNAIVSASLTINPAIPLSLAVSPTTVIGGNPVTGTITLTGAAQSGGLLVNLRSSTPAAIVLASVTVPAGATSANFTINTNGVASVVNAIIYASASTVNLQTPLTINPAVPMSITFNPASVTGGTSSTGTVTLNGAAPSAGVVVNMTSSSPNVIVPTSVALQNGMTSTTFVVNTKPIDISTPVTVTGTAGGTSVSGTLTVNPAAVSSVVLSPTSVQGGSPTTGTVTLNANAGPSGVTVTLSSNTSSAVPPATVQVPAGTNSTTFTVNTLAVQAQTSATITAVANGGSASTTLTINGDNLTGLSLNPTTVVGGNNCVGTVTLSGPAPAGGTVVSLGITAGPATVPNTVTVPAGSSSATFNIATTPVNASSTSTVTATLGTTNQTATLTVAPMALTGLSLNPTSVAGGNSSTGTVTLNGPAPSSGVSIALNSSLTSAATVPATITVAAGQSSATFTVNTFSTTKQKSATIQASFSGVNLSATAIGTATLDGPAPTGGVVVKLASSTTKAIVPASVTVAVGKTSMTFQVKTLAVASITTANITGTVGSSTQVGTLTINPPTLTSLTLTPTTVIGLTSSTGTLVISGPAPTGGLVVNLSSTQSAAIVPATATIPAGATKGTFTVKTVSVPVVTSASIKATLNAQSQSATLTINPPVITKLALSPASVKGGKTSTGTITLGTAAPTGGITVTLNSSNGVASVPATVTIAGGKTTGTFNVTTTVVTTQTTSNITATLPTSSKTATLTVTK